MKKLFYLFVFLSVQVQASETCQIQASLDALSEVKNIIENDISISKSGFSKPGELKVSFGDMRVVKKKLPEGVKSGVWVPIKIHKAGKLVWDVQQGFLYGDHCMRNRLAEVAIGNKNSGNNSIKE